MSTKEPPLVSVGLPVYNGGRYLGLAIESLLAQTYRNIELLISDNASTDDTQQICERFARIDSRVVYSRNEANIGAVKNALKLLNLASGDYYATASHDDLFSLNYIEANLIGLGNARDSVWCSPKRVVLIDENGHFLRAEQNMSTVGMDLPDRYATLLNRLGWYSYYGVTYTRVFREVLHSLGEGIYLFGSDVVLQAALLREGNYAVSESTFYFREMPRSAQDYAETLLPGSTGEHQPYSRMLKRILDVAERSCPDSGTRAQTLEAMIGVIRSHPLWQQVLTKEYDGLSEENAIRVFLKNFLPEDENEIPVWWREEEYLNAHPDVARAVQAGGLKSGYLHYVRFGRREGRALRLSGK